MSKGLRILFAYDEKPLQEFMRAELPRLGHEVTVCPDGRAAVKALEKSKFDVAILSELQNDGRLTNAELAQRVGLSAAPCWRRVRALEEAGYIKGYRAEIDRHKIGLGVLAFVRLNAERNNGDETKKLEAAIQRLPEVVACHYISGTGTFELQVVCRDLNSFSQFAREVLINLPNVKDLHTSFSLGEVKASSALPVQPRPSRAAARALALHCEASCIQVLLSPSMG